LKNGGPTLDEKARESIPHWTQNSRAIRRRIVEVANRAKEGHVPSSLSIVEILVAAFEKYKFNPLGDDRFVLSKGHASIGLFAAMEVYGYISPGSLDDFCKPGSSFGGHPDSTLHVAIEASTGSLGHGLPMACGIAFHSLQFESPKNVVCVIGDGECNEGSVWESAMLAANLKLSNLTCIVDFNHSGDRAVDMGSLMDKWGSFGWATAECDGHDVEAIQDNLGRLQVSQLPGVLICNTTKGKGVSKMENNPAWHHTTIPDDEVAELVEEINRA
jgi:transketolase